MQITIRLLASYRRYLPEASDAQASYPFQIPAGACVNDVLAELPIPEADYYMISGDDTKYPPYYVKKVTEYMEKEGTGVASGYSIEYGYKSRNAAPGGSGRIYTRAAWKVATPFYQNIGYETGALYRAMFKGHRLGFYPVPKSHLNPQGQGSTRSFGHGAHILGTPLIYTLVRAFKVLFSREHPPKNAFNILLGHLEYLIRNPAKVDISPQVRKWKNWQAAHTFKIGLHKLYIKIFKKNPLTQHLLYPIFLIATGQEDRRK